MGEDGKKAQSRQMPVLYERAIVCAASERFVQKTEHGWQVLKLPDVDFGRTT